MCFDEISVEVVMELLDKPRHSLVSFSMVEGIEAPARGTRESAGIDLRLVNDLRLLRGSCEVDLGTSATLRVSPPAIDIIVARSSVAVEGVEFNDEICVQNKKLTLTAFQRVHKPFKRSSNDRVAQLVSLLQFSPKSINVVSISGDMVKTGYKALHNRLNSGDFSQNDSQTSSDISEDWNEIVTINQPRNNHPDIVFGELDGELAFKQTKEKNKLEHSDSDGSSSADNFSTSESELKSVTEFEEKTASSNEFNYYNYNREIRGEILFQKTPLERNFKTQFDWKFSPSGSIEIFTTSEINFPPNEYQILRINVDAETSFASTPTNPCHWNLNSKTASLPSSPVFGPIPKATVYGQKNYSSSGRSSPAFGFASPGPHNSVVASSIFGSRSGRASPIIRSGRNSPLLKFASPQQTRKKMIYGSQILTPLMLSPILNPIINPILMPTASDFKTGQLNNDCATTQRRFPAFLLTLERELFKTGLVVLDKWKNENEMEYHILNIHSNKNICIAKGIHFATLHMICGQKFENLNQDISPPPPTSLTHSEMSLLGSENRLSRQSLELYTTEPIMLSGKSIHKIPSDYFSFGDIPKFCYMQLTTPSSLAETKITVFGGVVDRDYRQEVCVLLFNHSKDPILLEQNTLISECFLIEINIPIIVDNLSDHVQEENEVLADERRGGFGSTGM